ncbi:MAG: HEAT repeat domain-containing protein, partial [Bacteroidales bacterium]|nr:HEAT repeat domain-containing protein [Bacteroidales bacterium]
MRKISIILTGLLLSLISLAQDVRTLETKVADLLARMPVYNQNDLDRQMTQISELGYEGLTDICNRIVPPGGGDDTRARFAVESYSRYLSAYGYVKEQNSWEDICIEYVEKPADYNVKSFFMRQLQVIGGKTSTELAVTLLGDIHLCEPAVAVIAACKTQSAEKILIESLKKPDLTCAASIMNTLAGWKSDDGLISYILWYTKGDRGEKAAALNALAMSGNSRALKTLSDAAGDAGYAWDATGATAAYLEYAVQAGDRGDIKTLEKICREIMAGSDFEGGLQYRIAALEVTVFYREYESIGLLLEAIKSENIEYRHAALQFADHIKGRVATGKYIALINEVPPVVGAEIIKMLGDRSDLSAVTPLKRCLFSASQVIRIASTGAITRLCGKDAIDDIIDYMRSYPDWAEQRAGVDALVEISDSKRRDKIVQAMEGSSDITKINFLLVLADGGENKYFSLALKYTGADLYELRSMAFSSLAKLASSENQEELLNLLEKVEDQAEIEKVQLALAVAANQVEDEQMKAEKLLIALGNTEDRSKIIPVLPEVGGQKALRIVIKIFNEGAPGMRDICFDALANWRDYSASYALFDICRSGNKSYSTKAFYGYLRQVINAPVHGDQKLLLLRKIMPYALTGDQKASVISNISGVKSIQALVYVSGFFEDQELQQVAARSAMKIALPISGSEFGLYGDNVKSILLEIIEILDGEESDYHKERIKSYLSEMPDDPGFVSMFNGKDLDGWQGLVENPVARSK